MQICGHEYDVIIGTRGEYNREEDPFYFGTADHTRNIIHINPKSPRDRQEQTLIHEVIHCILSHCHDLGEHDERLVAAMANGFFQLGFGKYLWRIAKPHKKEE